MAVGAVNKTLHSKVSPPHRPVSFLRREYAQMRPDLPVKIVMCVIAVIGGCSQIAENTGGCVAQRVCRVCIFSVHSIVRALFWDRWHCLWHGGVKTLPAADQ